MIKSQRKHQQLTGRRHGISLVEVTVSTVIVGLIVVGAMQCLATSTLTAQLSADRTLGMLLAEDLMEEILQLDYSEPDDAVEFGTESPEEADLRTEWDDVDDYDDWVASPPVDRNGIALADASWQRSVTVSHVDPEDLTSVQLDTDDMGVKVITVTVSRDGVTVAELVSLQTRAWISTIPEYGEATTTGQLPPTNEPPTARIANHVSVGTGSLSVSFNGRSSSDPEDAPLVYEWDFGDGSSGSGEQPGHSFVNHGTETIAFTISLTVQDIHGATDTDTSTVTIFPSP